MNTYNLSRVAGVTILIGTLILGAAVAYATTATFKIKENKIFFNLVTDPENDGEQIVLPSVVGRTGHVYIYKVADTNNGTFFGTDIFPPPGETIDLGQSSVTLNGSNESVVFIGDESNNTWWAMANNTN